MRNVVFSTAIPHSLFSIPHSFGLEVKVPSGVTIFVGVLPMLSMISQIPFGLSRTRSLGINVTDCFSMLHSTFAIPSTPSKRLVIFFAQPPHISPTVITVFVFSRSALDATEAVKTEATINTTPATRPVLRDKLNMPKLLLERHTRTTRPNHARTSRADFEP